MALQQIVVPIATNTFDKTKMCQKCGTIKSIDLFNKNRSKNDGHASTCRDCVEDWRLWSTYHIRLSEYKEMLESQNGVCALCKQKDTNKLSVDHNHETGKVRGLLCTRCNWALGVLGDSLDELKTVIEYVRGGD